MNLPQHPFDLQQAQARIQAALSDHTIDAPVVPPAGPVPYVIVLAVDWVDGRTYLDARKWRRCDVRIVTAQNPDAARGLSGPVYATPRVQSHPAFDRMSEIAMPCSIIADRDRICFKAADWSPTGYHSHR